MNVFEKIAKDLDINGISKDELKQIVGDSFTPLLWAVKINKIKYIKVLINAGANIDETDSEGNNVLHLIAENDSTEALDFFQVNFNPNYNNLKIVKNHDGELPYHVACREGSHEVFKSFLDEMGPNVKNEAGFTPIFYAVANGDIKLIELLFSQTKEKVNLEILINEKSVFNYAEDFGDESIIKLLHEKSKPKQTVVKPTDDRQSLPHLNKNPESTNKQTGSVHLPPLKNGTTSPRIRNQNPQSKPLTITKPNKNKLLILTKPKLNHLNK